MKKLIYILLFIPFITVGQITDDSLRDYNDTYIIENITNTISATMINTLYEDIIDSKVNVDSATTFRWSTNRDSAFVNWWGYSVDTLFFYVQDDNTADADTIYISNDTAIYNIVPDNLVDGNGIVDFTYNGSAGATVEADTTVLASKVWTATRGYLVGGGWAPWSPTLSWTGTTPTINSSTYRWTQIDDVIYFVINLNVTGGLAAATDLSISLPVTPSDVDMLITVDLITVLGGVTFGMDFIPYIDAGNNTPANRLLRHGSFNVGIGENYRAYYRGFYEVD